MSNEIIYTDVAIVDPVVAEVQSLIIMGIGAALGFLLVDKVASTVYERRKGR